MEREAKCACGALSAIAEGDPVRLSICHCNACKRRTGSAFSWNATYDVRRVTIAGAFQSYVRDSDDGYWGRHSFCPTCGVSVFYEIERRPGMISIPAGAFADPTLPAPEIEVYDECACSWLPPLGIPLQA